jgi:hypothetical protein
MIFLGLTQRNAIPTLEEQFLLVPIGMTGQAIFPTPGGVGGAELFFGWLYEQVHKAGVYGSLACLAYRIINWALAFGGYVVYLWTRPALAAVTEPSAEELAAPEASVS